MPTGAGCALSSERADLPSLWVAQRFSNFNTGAHHPGSCKKADSNLVGLRQVGDPALLTGSRVRVRSTGLQAAF